MSEKPLIILRMPEIREQSIERARELAPDHEILVQPEPEELERRIGEAEIIFGRAKGALLDRAANLRWLQIGGAGFRLESQRLLEDGVVVTNVSGMHADSIAEGALSFILSFQRYDHLARDYKAKKVWARNEVSAEVREHWTPLQERTLGIVGHGRIGRRLAQAAHGLGMRVLALRNHPRPDEFTETVVGPGQLPLLLAESDFLVCLLPGTEEARHFLGREQFAQMKPGAVVINFGRGSCIDECALIEALREGRLRGAGLDVFEQEPLPPSSPLWEMPNVLMSYHYGGARPEYGHHAMQIFLRNLERYIAGQPLENVVDARRGY